MFYHFKEYFWTNFGIYFYYIACGVCAVNGDLGRVHDRHASEKRFKTGVDVSPCYIRVRRRPLNGSDPTSDQCPLGG